jgi:hypothetical protein
MRVMLGKADANPSSGGQVTGTDVDAFLNIGKSGPKFARLRRLLNGRTHQPPCNLQPQPPKANGRPSLRRAVRS